LLAGMDGTFDEAAVRKQAMAVANLEAELAVLRARALSQIQPALTPEQIEKIRNAAPAGLGARAGAPGGARGVDRPAARRRALSDTPRDENNLPPKR
jgi:Spy/CpxP family protein refolding chaperone